eukprot:612314-Hanusia_phi.AAC.6
MVGGFCVAPVAAASSCFGTQSLDSSASSSWSKNQYSADQVKSSYGVTFGGMGNKVGPYGIGASQKAYDMAYYLNGKYQVKERKAGQYL